MPTDFDNAIGDMVDDLLTEGGETWVYCRGNVTATLTARRSIQRPLLIDSGTGSIVEVRPVDFILLTTALPYAVPERGDLIKGDGKTYELQPTVGEKVWRQISPQMTRLHTKQIG